MKIVPNQTFLDGTDRFEAGVEYEVDEARAFYFGRVGWLKDVEPVEPAPEEVTLSIDSSGHGHEGGEL